MRKWFLLPALILPFAATLQAQPPLRDPVEVEAMGFNAVINDGRVISSWKRYKRDDFSEYHLVKSLANAKPDYPEDQNVYTSTAKDDIRFEDGKLTEGAWHYRLCIVTRFGDRWVSPVITVNISKNDLKRAAPTAADFEGP
jgi:hypothetical protein